MGSSRPIKPSRMVAKRTTLQRLNRLESVVTQLFVETADLSGKFRDLAILTGHAEKVGIDPLEHEPKVELKSAEDLAEEMKQVDLEEAIAEAESDEHGSGEEE